MLRVVAQKSAAAALKYYSEGLKREDYYSQQQEVAGKWHGKAAARLGLDGEVLPQMFAALVKNRYPLTGEKLTPRMKAGRRVGYDINFHAPKSLSVLQALMGDERITAVFREAVAETMAELEERVGTRVRKGGASGSRATGNFAWAEFVHFTARPVGVVPDPHLHVHAFTFNLTFDEVEQRWKAAELHDVVHDAPYFEAAFHARLSGKVAALGYAVERSVTGWEVAGVPDTLLHKFSSRTAQVERAARELGITDPKEKAKLGAKTRSGKRHGLAHSDLLAEWGKRLSEDEKALLSRVRFGNGPKAKPREVKPAAAVTHALEKCFAKDSVTQPHRLVAEALKYAPGCFRPEQIWRELSSRELVTRQFKGETLCTTLEVLAEEVALTGHVRQGRGKFPPTVRGRKGSIGLAGGKWTKEQRQALQSILTSTSQVIAIRGGAGVGKTTLMVEAARQIEERGQRIFAFAPSAAASRGTLREEGFANANTVAHLLTNKRLQEQTRGQVIWIDEAGLLGIRDLWQVMQIAGSSTRVILTGDSYQHAPVPRGDAFRILSKYAGLPIIEVTKIRRQQVESYKLAVKALSRGNLAEAFRRLDELGAVVEVESDAERYRLLAQDYIDLSRKRGKPPLVVSPTHAEGRLVTEAIRDAKRQAGQLRGEREFLKFENLQWDDADKKLPRNYRPGLMVQFHQNARGIVRGAMLEVTGYGPSGVVMAKDGRGRKIELPIQHPERFQVFEAGSIVIGRGDMVRITQNGTSADGRRLNNGNVYAVQKFTRSGGIVLSNGMQLDAGHGHIAHGYCQTSHSSQSKSVRDVLVAQSAKSFVASSREQFYVSVSRGKESIRIYTDDLRGLREAVGLSSTRLAGVELAGLNSKDIVAMSEALNSKQWQEVIRSRVAGAEGTRNQQLLSAQRRNLEPRQADQISWKRYVEMRRGMVGPDGKSRSKGMPSAPQKKNGGNLAQKRRSFPRPTEHTAPVAKQLKEAHARKKAEGSQADKKPEPAKQQAKKKGSSRIQRMTEKVKSSARNFRQTVMKGKAPQPKPGPKPQPGKKELKAATPEKAARQKLKRRDAEFLKERGKALVKANVKIQQAARPVAPRK